MANVYFPANEGGKLTVGASASDKDTYIDGTAQKNVSLRKRLNTYEDKALGDTYTDVEIVSASFEMSAGLLLPKTGTDGAFVLPTSEVYAEYTARSGTVLFSGSAMVSEISDEQSDGSFVQQSITLVSSGAPVTPS